MSSLGKQTTTAHNSSLLLKGLRFAKKVPLYMKNSYLRMALTLKSIQWELTMLMLKPENALL